MWMQLLLKHKKKHMSNIPDFVLQIQEVERNLMAQWALVQEDWRDSAGESFQRDIMEPYTRNFHKYITGEGIKGYGVDKLVQQMDRHLQDMERLTGISANFAFACAAGPQYNGKIVNWYDRDIDIENDERVKARSGIVHNELRERDYWNDRPSSVDYDGVKPGELQSGNINEIMKKKNE